MVSVTYFIHMQNPGKKRSKEEVEGEKEADEKIPQMIKEKNKQKVQKDTTQTCDFDYYLSHKNKDCWSKYDKLKLLVWT